MVDIVELLKKQPDFYATNGVPEEDIRAAEQMLELEFATDYRSYISTYGVVSFAGHELTGICKSKRLNVVNVTLEERNNMESHSGWYVLERANIDGIVIWQDSNGSIYQQSPRTSAQKICNSLSEYIEW